MNGVATRRIRLLDGRLSSTISQTWALRHTCRNTGSSLSPLHKDASSLIFCVFPTDRCITSPPRLWQEVASLYSQPTTNVFSGGIAFSYFPTSDGYGMVTFGGSNGQQYANLLLTRHPVICTDMNSPSRRVETSADFTRLVAQLSNVTAPPNSPSQSSVQVTEGACPSAENSTFEAATVLPPTPDKDVCNCLYEKSFSCVVAAATANDPAKVGALTE